MGYEGNIKCSNCGSEYELYKHKLIMRDNDYETCDVCGDILKKWNGAMMYSTKLIKKENPNNKSIRPTK